MKKLALYAVTATLTAAVCFALILSVLPRARAALKPILVDSVLASMSEEDRLALYDEIAAKVGSLWDAVPEPRVARLGKRNLDTVADQAEVRLNNAGLRSARPFGGKPAEVFRIICLGDSFVFGHGAAEADRFCDQMEEFYREAAITVDGRRIELYAIGIDSWTAIQEASYLSSRITAYDPDVIVVLTTGNDITDMAGVTGAGTSTHSFSPERRDSGSGVFVNQAGAYFGARRYSIITSDLVPAARAKWAQSMSALKRLSLLQQSRGKKILHSVLVIEDRYFSEVYKHAYSEAGIDAPFIIARYPKRRETKLAHDGHPNRLGHGILASQFVHALDTLGWVSVPQADLPDLDEDIGSGLSPAPVPAELDRLRREFAEPMLGTSLDFARMTSSQARSLLGGIYPAGKGDPGGPPWASVRSGFALKRPRDSEIDGIELVIRIPPRVELFPFRLEIQVDGQLMGRREFPQPGASNEYQLFVEAPKPAVDDLAVEVVLRTDSYFAGITDAKMKSFRIVSARIR